MVQTAAVAIVAVVAVLSVVVLLTLWSSYHRVPEGEVEILLVFGEVRRVLEPGIYFVPPFVSGTHSIDLRTMQYETRHGRRSVPSEYRDEVERIAEDRAATAKVRR